MPIFFGNFMPILFFWPTMFVWMLFFLSNVDRKCTENAHCVWKFVWNYHFFGGIYLIYGIDFFKETHKQQNRWKIVLISINKEKIVFSQRQNLYLLIFSGLLSRFAQYSHGINTNAHCFLFFFFALQFWCNFINRIRYIWFVYNQFCWSFLPDS